MWDPRNYSDSDFGLDANERFEPKELDEPEIDVTRDRHVMTVLGPIDPGDLGIAQTGEHLLAGGDEAEADLRLDDVAKAIEELTSFVTAGGKSIIDMTTQAEGRDLLGLLDIARRVPAHMICSTSAEAGSESMLREIVDGVGPRRIRPGLITVRNSNDQVQESADIARETRLPLYVNDPDRRPGTRLLESIEGLPVVMVHSAEQLDIGNVREWLAAGNTVLFGGVGRSQVCDVELASALVELAADGFGDRLLISQILRRRSEFLAWGGQPGLIHLLERFTLTMMEAGTDAMFVRKLLIDNPAQALTIEPTS